MRVRFLITLLLATVFLRAEAQLNLNRVVNAGKKGLQAATLTDAQIEGYVKEFIVKSDTENKIADKESPYTKRLDKILGKINNNNGLNVKVYIVQDVNAFACADGSIRVYSGLMDIMSDDEVLGVIGHEIGHVHNKDTKDAFRTALINSAVREGIASTNEKVAKLTDSQVGTISEAFFNSKYSRKQEYDADDYGYEFLKQNGKNPWAMALSFEKLQQLQNASGAKSSAIEQLFSTHPDIVLRTKRMAERATKDGYKK